MIASSKQSKLEQSSRCLTKPDSDRPETFNCFPNLPIEIRLKIWGLILKNPGIIGFRPKLEYDKIDRYWDIVGLEPFTTPLNEKIALRSVSKETRKEVQRLLGPVQDSRYNGWTRGDYNWSTDTIWIADWNEAVWDYLDSRSFRCSGLAHAIRLPELPNHLNSSRRLESLMEKLPDLPAISWFSSSGRKRKSRT